MNRIRTLLAILFCLASAAVHAQWQWIDKDGRRVFSDRAPPADIAQKNIIRQPGPAPRVATPAAMAGDAPARPASAAADASGDNPADGAVPKLGAVDKDLLERKRKSESEAAAKTRAEAERSAKTKADNCQRARANKALMESGVRVSFANAKGEREVIDDAARAAELQRAQSVINANCN